MIGTFKGTFKNRVMGIALIKKGVGAKVKFRIPL